MCSLRLSPRNLALTKVKVNEKRLGVLLSAFLICKVNGETENGSVPSNVFRADMQKNSFLVIERDSFYPDDLVFLLRLLLVSNFGIR